MSRVGGFSPTQWVLGRLPRRGAGFQGDEEGSQDVGSMQARVDGQTEFAKRADYRESAKKAFVHHDCSVKVQKAMLRKAAPLVGEYRVGDVVAFQREQGAETHDDRWNPGSRIIGFDKGETCWVVNGGVPFCVATDQLRPCTAAEALAYAYTQKQYGRAPANQQQSFVDYRKVRGETTRTETDYWIPAGTSSEEGTASDNGKTSRAGSIYSANFSNCRLTLGRSKVSLNSLYKLS